MRVLDEDLARLSSWRRVFEAAQQALTARGTAVDPEFLSTMREVYAHALAIGIRRQLKPGSRNISLAGLLEDVAANPRAAGVDAGTVRRDIAELRRVAKPAEHFADRVVAHRDRRAGATPAPEELGRILAHLVQLCRAYHERVAVPPL